MAQIIIGLVLFGFGIWGIVVRWYSFVDLVFVLLPLLLALTGIVAIVNGINCFAIKSGRFGSRAG